MERMRKLCIWCYLLTKRLYRRWSFLVIMLLIPVTVLVYRAATDQQSGVLTVALAQEDPQDPLASQVIQQLGSDSDLILFKIADSPERARQLVQMSKADAAWIFPSQLQQRVQAFVTGGNSPAPIAQVVVRQKNVALMLANEKLSGALFEECARAYYLHYLRENVDAADALTDMQLLEIYDGILPDEQLFAFCDIHGNAIPANKEAGHYLLSPLRGLMGVILLLCGLATAMYTLQDRQNGCLCRIPSAALPLAELGYQMVSLLNMGVICFVCVCAIGLRGSIPRELLILLLYPICCGAFCQLLGSVFTGMRAMGAMLPLVVIGALAICPVFYNFAALRYVQFLLPPTYFVQAPYNDLYLWLMPVYAAVCFGLSMLLRLLGRKL